MSLSDLAFTSKKMHSPPPPAPPPDLGGPLGGLFAGLAGMIFAVPVASVLKFLIPRLYQSFFQSDELELPGRGEGVVSSE